MPVGVAALSIARPGRPGTGHRIPASDEDGFTVTADAIEAIEEALRTTRKPSRVGRVWMLGNLDDDAGWMIPELAGARAASVTRKENDRESFWSTIQSIAGRRSAEGDDLVVAASVREDPAGNEVNASALLLRSDEGLRVDSVGSVAAPRTHAVDVATAVRIELKNSRSAGSELPPVVVLESPGPEGVDWTPGTPALTSLARWVKGQPTGGTAILVDQDARGPSYYAEVHLDSAVVVSGPWSERRNRATGKLEPPAPRDPSIPFRVSEGAYIPWATYRASLGSRWRFVAERCPACDSVTFPARHRCAHCGSDEGLTEEELARQNLEVLASTIIHPGAQPTEFDPQVSASGPYAVLLLQLADGIRATVQLAEPGAHPVPLGARVDTRIRRLYPMEGRWRYGRKAFLQRSPPEEGGAAAGHGSPAHDA